MKYDLNKFFVLIEEEYGMNYWIWFPSFDKKELVTWWGEQPLGNPFVVNLNKLNGDVFKLDENEEQYFIGKCEKNEVSYAHFHIDEDSYICIDGIRYHHNV